MRTKIQLAANSLQKVRSLKNVEFQNEGYFIALENSYSYWNIWTNKFGEYKVLSFSKFHQLQDANPTVLIIRDHYNNTKFWICHFPRN